MIATQSILPILFSLFIYTYHDWSTIHTCRSFLIFHKCHYQKTIHTHAHYPFLLCNSGSRSCKKRFIMRGHQIGITVLVRQQYPHSMICTYWLGTLCIGIPYKIRIKHNGSPLVDVSTAKTLCIQVEGVEGRIVLCYAARAYLYGCPEIILVLGSVKFMLLGYISFERDVQFDSVVYSSSS